jgi:NTE family protein
VIVLRGNRPFGPEAVRASMSIPFFYEPLQFKYRGDGGTPEISYMVDGGMLSNFPIDVFDRTDGKPPRWPTFGLKLSAKPDAALHHKYRVKGTWTLATAMLGTMTGFHDQIHVEDPATLARTMFIETYGIRATDFDIDESMQDMLYASGRKAATDFLAGWDFERYIALFRTGAEEASVDVPI